MPMFQSLNIWDATITGTNAEKVAAQYPDERYGLPYETTAAFEPKSGSNAYQTASGGTAYDDLRSTVRHATTPSRGAHEPTSDPYFTVLPSLDQRGYVVGDTVTLSNGTAPGSTITVTKLELDGVDKTGEISGGTWDTTGESPGTITFETTADGTMPSGPVTAELVAAAPVVDSVTPDAFSNPTHGVTITGTNVSDGDRVYGIALLDGASAPSAQEVYDMRLDNDDFPLGRLRNKWGNDFTITWNIKNDGSNDGDYRLWVVIDNGVLSNVLSSGIITVVA